MSWTRGQSPGWAAFNVKQRKKQGLETEVDKEPFPPVLTTLTSLRPHNNSTARSFSSLLLPSVDFPTLAENRDCKKLIQVSHSSGKHGNNFVGEDYHVLNFEKLKELHCWADDSLIKDIMRAVDNDIDKASTLLKEILPARSIEGNKQRIQDLNSSDNNLKSDKGISLGKNIDLADLGATLEDCLQESDKELTDECASSEKKLFNDSSDMKLIMEHLRSIPAEPEWEEDDVYLIHRKDAIRTMRSASHHSKAATNAFLKGDHFSARQHSLKAQDEWLAAERLNAKAAKEILSLRNGKNDTWKLDLHGLHAVEAIQALQEHLQKIETQLLLKNSVSPNRVRTKKGTVHSPPLESFSCMEDMMDKEQLLSRQRQASLQVITGIGNHSRGQAALPIAVKSFLNENGYRFDEARPGLITVRPKFRHQ